jgi:hypothetical protein
VYYVQLPAAGLQGVAGTRYPGYQQSAACWQVYQLQTLSHIPAVAAAMLRAAGLYPALAAACEAEATVLQRLQQQFEQQLPEQQRSLSNGDAQLMSVHLNLSKWLLSLWVFTSEGALNLTRFTAAFAPVVGPLVKLTMQQLQTCSVVTASLSSSSSGSGSSVHPLLEAANSSLSQVFMTTDHICCTIAEGIALDARGQGNAAAMRDATSDNAMRLLLAQLAAAAEQLYYQQRRKLRKAAAAAPSSSSSSSAAAAAVDLPEPYHQQLFTALGLPAADKVRRSNDYLTGPFMQGHARGVNGSFIPFSEAVLYKQERRVIEPLIRGGSCGGAAAGTRHWSISSSSSSSSSGGAAAQVSDPVLPADLIRPLLLTLAEVCLLDAPLILISSCSELMWVLLASSAWLPGAIPPGSSAAAAVAAAAQLQQRLRGAAGVQKVLQLLMQRVAPVVIAAHKRGKLTGPLRSHDDSGALKGHSRSVTIQGFGGALISLACSGEAVL